MYFADWDYWKQIPKTDLYSAVQLSFGIDPRDEEEILSTNRNPLQDSEAIPDEQLKQRHKIAIANLYHGLDVEANDSPKGQGFFTVSLAKFATWVVSKNWKIPPELKEMAGAKNETQINATPFAFDTKSLTYPPELDVALQAWRAVSATEDTGKPKARIKVWLDSNTSLSTEAKKRIAIVANWDKKGGATRTD